MSFKYILIGFFWAYLPNFAFANAACDDFADKKKESSIGALTVMDYTIVELAVACLQATTDDLAAFRSEILVLQAEAQDKINQARALSEEVNIQHNHYDIEVPSGAVLAFDRLDGCPEGWKAGIAEAEGRLIIGVKPGTKYVLPYNALKPDYQTGGTENHLLLKKELPSHQHYVNNNIGFDMSYSQWGGDPNTKVNVMIGTGFVDNVPAAYTSSVGGNIPHENMPPWLALYYCKKE